MLNFSCLPPPPEWKLRGGLGACDRSPGDLPVSGVPVSLTSIPPPGTEAGTQQVLHQYVLNKLPVLCTS